MPKTKKPELPVLAIDLGGTKIITAIFDNNRLIAKERCLTMAGEGQQSVINRLLSSIDHILSLKNMDLSQLGSISIAAAGGIDIERGLVTSSPHLPDWQDVPLRDIVKEKYQVDTFLLNDASAAALGEHRFGAGKGVSNLILLTVGTGIGGGIIINGRLYNGPYGSAGEIGHMTIDVNGLSCQCGNIGCLETLASGTAMAREARRRIAQGESSCLLELVADRTEDVTAENIGVAARGGDSLALDVIAGAGTYLGVGMVNLVNIFNPEMIVVGGGVANLGDLLLDPARQVVKERAFRISARAVRIVTAQLGDEAGVYGAAVFALEQKN
ncbi:MAG: ROK family protein [Dehalococcoidales bacterium]